MKFDYSPTIKREIERVLRHGVFAVGTPLRPVSQQDDFGGIDALYVVEQYCPLQLRCRFNRPYGACDADVTFRETEPAMMLNGTYAPLAVFFWFNQDDRIIAGRIVDVERMIAGLAAKGEPLNAADRRQSNFDGGPGFYCVGIGELHDARALLKTFDGDHWATETAGGQMRIRQILAAAKRRYERHEHQTLC